LVIQLKNLRLLLQVARQDAQPVAPRTLREWWRWLRRRGDEFLKVPKVTT
jgi:hypothetical protein